MAGIGEETPELADKNILVEGLANKNCFPVTYNSFDSWDPKLGFGNRCVILDNGNFYQWEIAKLEEVEGSHRGRWHSGFLNLQDLEEFPDKLFGIQEKLNKNEIDIRSARRFAKFLYRELERKRQPIRAQIMDFHRSKIHSIKSTDQISKGTIAVSRTKMDESTYGTPHSSRQLNVSMETAFAYYSDIEAYPERYADYCKKIEVIEKSQNKLITKEFWNIMIDENIDHVVLDVHYTLIPPKEIRYEITGGYPKAIGIKNALVLKETKEKRIFVHQNNVLLDIICFPPHRIRYGDYHFQNYHDKINYFTIKDCIRLEGKPMEGFKEGQLCPKCKSGHLEKSAKKEDYQTKNFRRRVQFWICDICGKEFKHTMVETSDEMSF